MDKLKRRRVGYRNGHSVALVSGDNDGVLGVVVLMVLQIVAGLVSALLSISRLTLTGQNFFLGKRRVRFGNVIEATQSCPQERALPPL